MMPEASIRSSTLPLSSSRLCPTVLCLHCGCKLITGVSAVSAPFFKVGPASPAAQQLPTAWTAPQIQFAIPVTTLSFPVVTVVVPCALTAQLAPSQRQTLYAPPAILDTEKILATNPSAFSVQLEPTTTAPRNFALPAAQ